MSRKNRPEKSLSRGQKRLLRDLANGGCFFAALHEPDNYALDDVVFSERTGITVHPAMGCKIEDRYRVRNKTAGALYMADMVDCHEGDSGYRQFHITDKGRSALKADGERT